MKAARRNIDATRNFLFEKLKEEHAFWSYAADSITLDKISDDQLIAYTMRHLDLPEIDRLFEVFSFQKIKKAWVDLLVPEGDYLFTLNRFFAWYYFQAKRPDAYLKNLITRYQNRPFS